MEDSKGVKRISNVSKPTLTVFRPAKDKDTGAAVRDLSGRRLQHSRLGPGR